MQDINLTAKEGVSEIIVRTGDAPKVHDPVKYSFEGNISAPLEYFNARVKANMNYFDAKLAVVEVNERDYKIIIRRDPKDVFAETVSGQLKKNPDIEAIGVNTGEQFKPSELAKRLKKNRIFFSAIADAMRIISDLQSLKVSAKSELEQSDDRRGNTKNVFVQSVETNMPVSFQLAMPIFNGDSDVSFAVEVSFEVSGQQVLCSLDSIELTEYERRRAHELLTEQAEQFVTSGIPVLYK